VSSVGSVLLAGKLKCNWNPRSIVKTRRGAKLRFIFIIKKAVSFNAYGFFDVFRRARKFLLIVSEF
jgi:hypothetical protein